MPAKPLHRYGDDDTPFDDKLGAEVSELMTRLQKQFHRLQLKAASIGIQSVVVIHAHDPLTGYAFRRSKRIGDHYANLGATIATADELRSMLAGDED